ncbi:aldo-keto reductase [Mytilinidion resinicola]|uniref:Aldo-keto reductase n=1 Tax=Mytilinidion resinicola TaxID=574789 RepID=A0A6A6YEQ7_9PEZI|nr:aldo-keto reductase [Mytilinidion resinicola]KAF2807220.1 aldo-keto reductase [Mytilinidion resinicola]
MSDLPFVYGTAWKNDETACLVSQALDAGFIAFDTAAQPKNYREDMVGQALRAHCGNDTSKRESLFIQTKFTPSWSQDLDSIPYNAAGTLEDQVRDSIQRSLWNLRFSVDQDDSRNYIDAVLLHTPLKSIDDTLRAWQVLEEFVPRKIKQLGIANTNLTVLKFLWTKATTKPGIVQNPFHAKSGYDMDIRSFCRKTGVMYQSFLTLTANEHLLISPPVIEVALATQASPESALYALTMALGVIVLNGTKSKSHMLSDLQEVARIMSWMRAKKSENDHVMLRFGKFLEPESEQEDGSSRPLPPTA